MNNGGGNAIRGDGYGTSIGVYGEGADGPGVAGRSVQSNGVEGYSTNGRGVYASSDAGVGVYAESNHLAALYGHSVDGLGLSVAYGTGAIQMLVTLQ